MESTLCKDDCEEASERIGAVSMEDLAELGYELTGVYVSPKSVFNPGMWVSLVSENISPEILTLASRKSEEIVSFAETALESRNGFESSQDVTNGIKMAEITICAAVATFKSVWVGSGPVGYIRQGNGEEVGIELNRHVKYLGAIIPEVLCPRYEGGRGYF